MSPDRDYEAEMHRFPFDDNTADRLLSGAVAPEDAPPGLAGLASLVRAASGPASDNELARLDAVVAMSAELAVTSSSPASAPRRKTVLSKLLTAKVVAAATVAAFGLGTAAAAATGSLPGQTSHASTHAAQGLATAAAKVSASSSDTTSSTSSTTSTTDATTAGTTTSSNSIPATGMANAHAQFGLCTAFLNANGPSSSPTTSGPSAPSTPPQDSSAAFKALIGQNGGIPATVTYCQGVVQAGKSSSSTEPTGKPADTGKPAGAGKPPTAGSSGGHAHVSTPNSGGTGTADGASGGASSSGTATADGSSGGASSAGSSNAGH